MTANIRRWLHKQNPNLEDAREHGWSFRPDRRYPGYFKQARIGDPIRPPDTARPELHPINAKAWGFELVTHLPHKHQYTAEAECHELHMIVDGRSQTVTTISYPAFIYEHPQVLCAARRQHTWVVSFKIDPHNGDAILDKKCWGCMRRPADGDGQSRVCTVKGMRIARSTARYAAFLLPSMSSTEFFRQGGWPGRRLPRDGHTAGLIEDDEEAISDAETVQLEDDAGSGDHIDDDDDPDDRQDRGGGLGMTPNGPTGTASGSGTRTISSEPNPRQRPAKPSARPEHLSAPVGKKLAIGERSRLEAPRRRLGLAGESIAHEEVVSLPRGPSDVDGAYGRLRPSPTHRSDTVDQDNGQGGGQTIATIAPRPLTGNSSRTTESKPSGWSMSSRRREMSPAGNDEIVAVEMSSIDFDEIKMLRSGAARRPRQSNISIPCSQDV